MSEEGTKPSWHIHPTQQSELYLFAHSHYKTKLPTTQNAASTVNSKRHHPGSVVFLEKLSSLWAQQVCLVLWKEACGEGHLRAMQLVLSLK